MRSAPNHTAATLDRLMVSSTAGNITAIIRPVFSDVSVRSALAVPKRAASSGSRTKARTTRMPLICSRSTWFTRSMRSCILVNCGCIRSATWPDGQQQDRDGDDEDQRERAVFADGEEQRRR